MNMSAWWLKLAVLYLLAGVGLGLFMAASHDHSMFPVHAHLNLLGWVSMALFGCFYRLWPAAASGRLAKVHFWLYAPSHFVQMVLLAALFRGHPAVEPALAAASMLVAAALACFAAIVWMHAVPARASQAGVQPAGATG